MRPVFPALLVLFAPLPVAADDATITLPKEVRVAPATIGEVKAQTTGKQVKWVTPAGLSCRPIDGGRTLLVSGPVGRYDCWAYTAVGDVPSDPARTTVVIGEAPGPTPPADPLTAKIKAAFDAETADASTRRKQSQDLAELYRQIGAKVCPDPAIVSPTDLLDRARKAAATMIGTDALPGVRRAVASELAVILPTADGTLTADQRTALAELFKKLAAILDGLATSKPTADS